MTKVNDPGGPLRGVRYKIEVLEAAVQPGADDRVVSTTEVRDLISGIPEALRQIQGPARRSMHPLKVRFTCLQGDPTLVTEAMIAFRMRRPTTNANIRD